MELNLVGSCTRTSHSLSLSVFLLSATAAAADAQFFSISRASSVRGVAGDRGVRKTCDPHSKHQQHHHHPQLYTPPCLYVDVMLCQ